MQPAPLIVDPAGDADVQTELEVGVALLLARGEAMRDAAFDASRFAIEEIKKTVPIWKKEVYEGGEVWIGTQTGQPLRR